MQLSEIINLVLGGGLVATIIAIITLKATVREANAKAEMAAASAETVRIDNADKATRILIDNIVKPLKEELNDTKRELTRNTREMARLRKALNSATSCPHSDDCPVLAQLREPQKDGGGHKANRADHRADDGPQRQPDGTDAAAYPGGDTPGHGDAPPAAGQPGAAAAEPAGDPA